MKAPQRARYRAALEKLRVEALQTGPARIEPNRKDPATVGVSDEDEQALSEMVQALSSQRNKQRAELLRLVVRALKKIDDSPDDFGLCEECEEDIPSGRLDALPYAPLCAECQSKHDPRRGVARKSTTDFR